ncbi:hypothetical protein [Algoriphagus aquimarinus]|uniref:hypothetical protein n=1 Tax=Algoriphagus aquimarinus TaxID=237018 RepID=UPI0030D9522E
MIEVASSSLDLKEVTVGGIKNPVTQRNDTISYDISGFSTVNDRVLSDVLKRLPGIEVLSNGMIQYQGRPLVKFYIEGLDLLQGRYNLANKNLPIDAIESVEVLENHQPIKVLDSLVFSDRAALNISLKRKNTWIGTGHVGAGGGPFIADTKISPMVFREDFQALFSIQGNNFGGNLADEQKSLTLDDLLDLVNKKDIKGWFTFPGLEMAGLPKERARFNESYLGSANVLMKNSKGTELRINVDFNQEDLAQSKNSFTTYFLPNTDTISFVENIKLDNIRRKILGGLNWNRNATNSYFDNSTSFELIKNDFGGNVFFNQNPISETASLPMIRLENKLKLITLIKNNLFDVRSTVSFQKSQQELFLRPSVFDTNGNSVGLYDLLIQSIDFQRIFMNNSLGLTFKTRNAVNIQSAVGVSVLMDKLASVQSIDSIGRDQLLPFERNKADFENVSTYIKNSLAYEKNGFQVKADVPLYVAYFKRNDLAASQSSSFSRIYLEPYLNIKYQLSGKVSSSISFRKSNEFGTGEDYYSNSIISSYRNIDISDSRVPESIRLMLNYGLNYKNPVFGLFFDLSAAYSKTDKNVIAKYSLFESGGMAKSLLDFENQIVQRALSLRGSKYLTDLYTTITISSSIQFQDYAQVTNEALVDYSNRIFLTGFEVAVKPKEYIGLDVKTSLNVVNSMSDQSGVAKIKQVNSELGLDIFPIQNHLIRAQFQYVSNKIEMSGTPQRSSFLDLSYRFTPLKSRMDFSVICKNILDADVYRSYFSNGFVVGFQEMPLRPRQFLIKINFSF